jgi:hypothetical protein
MSQPLFILSPPRSYSSVIAAMLGQHPRCYGLPELNLFIADNLGAVWARLERIMPYGRDGLLRVLAQLHDGEQTEATIEKAKTWVQDKSGWSGKQVFDHIQQLVGDRILVEKSPMTVMQPENLERMRRAFPEASYIHLTRHPRAVCKSLKSLAGRSEEWGGRLSRISFDPEQIWLKAHENVIAFSERLAVGQILRIKGEEFLVNLEIYLGQIAQWLGIRRDDDAIAHMLHPERSAYAHCGPDGAKYGNDLDFLNEPELDLNRLASIEEPRLHGELEWRGGGSFSSEIVRLTKQFGYR